MNWRPLNKIKFAFCVDIAKNVLKREGKVKKLNFKGNLHKIRSVGGDKGSFLCCRRNFRTTQFA